MNQKIQKLIKKAIKITPEDEFKLRLKKELEEQKDKRLVNSITKDVIENLVPLDDKVSLVAEKVYELEEKNNEGKIMLKKHRLVLEEINGRVEGIKEDVVSIKNEGKKINTKELNGALNKINKIADGQDIVLQELSAQESLLNTNKNDINLIANNLVALLLQNKENGIKLADNSKEGNENLEVIKGLFKELLAKDNSKNVSILNDIKEFLSNIKDDKSLSHIQDLLGKLVNKKEFSTKELELVLKDVYDVLLKAWLPSENAIQVIVKNQIQPVSGGGAVVPFQDVNRNPVKPLVNSNGALSVITSNYLPSEGQNPAIVLGYDENGNLTTITKTIDGTSYVKTLTYTNNLLTNVSSWT